MNPSTLIRHATYDGPARRKLACGTTVLLHVLVLLPLMRAGSQHVSSPLASIPLSVRLMSERPVRQQHQRLPSVPYSHITDTLSPPLPSLTEPSEIEPANSHPPSVEPSLLAVTPRCDVNYLNNPAPAYPPLSRRLREQGTVLLRVHVDADGRATEVEVKSSSGSPRLDQAALLTVRQWRFVPGRLGGQAIAAWVLVPVAFSLSQAPA